MVASRTPSQDHPYRGRTIIDARGGISGGAILTGVVVAFGSMFLLSAIVGGVIAALGMTAADVAGATAVRAGIGAGIVLIVAQFLSYLWGGYTAGRMARGAGMANGLLVPLVAIVVAIAVAAVVAVLGATATMNLPFSTSRLPLEADLVVDWGLAISIGSLIAMFAGGALGGGLGARWHTKLERRTLDETPAATPAPVADESAADESAPAESTSRREVDLRESPEARRRAVAPGPDERVGRK